MTLAGLEATGRFNRGLELGHAVMILVGNRKPTPPAMRIRSTANPVGHMLPVRVLSGPPRTPLRRVQSPAIGDGSVLYSSTGSGWSCCWESTERLLELYAKGLK